MDKIQKIEELFLFILNYSYLLPLLTFLLWKPRAKGKDVFIIITYGIVFFLLNKFYLSIKFTISPLVYYSCYTFLEFFCFSLLFLFNFNSKKIKVVIILFQFLFAAFQVLFLFTARIRNLDAIPVGVETLLIYFYIFYFFYDRFQNVKDEYIYNDHCFWISIGLMLYLGGSFFFYILSNHMEEAELKKHWYITYIIETVKNILFSVAIIVHTKHKSKQKTPNQNLPYLDFN